MKKLLSLVLVLAMVFSCVSMISIFAGGSENVGVKLTATKALAETQAFNYVNAGLSASDVKNGTIMKTYKVTNPTDHSVIVTVEWRDGWDELKGHNDEAKTITVLPKTTIPFGLMVAVEDDNTISYNSGAASAQLANIVLRIDTFSAMAAGESIYVSWDGYDKQPADFTTGGQGGNAYSFESVASVPAPQVKAVTNGDAQAGSINWDMIHGGTTTIVKDTDNTSNNIAQFDPQGSMYASIAFNLGPAIIKDAEYGYAGAGAGEYKLTFRAKAEAGKGGKFNFVLNSKNHQEKDTINKYTGLNTTTGSYKTYTPIELTDTWQNFEITFKVDQEFLDKLKALYESAHSKAKDTYDLVLRLDGSSNAFKESQFKYFVDDVKIEKASTDPVGVKFEITEDIGAGYPIWRKENPGFTQAMADASNNINLSYDVYNTSTEEISIDIQIQKGWNPTYAVKTLTIPAGQKANAAFVIATDGNGNVLKSGAAFSTLQELSIRVEIKNSSLKSAGTSFVIAAPVGDVIYNIGNAMIMDGNGTGKTAKTVVTSLPAVATPTPVVDKTVVNGDAENGKTGWSVFTSGGGTTTIVEPGADGTGHAAKFTATGKYDSIGFDLGPAIVQDAANGYKGGGAGRYTVTFKAKADAGKSGKFAFVLNSQCHASEGTNHNIGGIVQQLPTHSYFTVKSIELTDQWQEYTITFNVPENFLEAVKMLRNSTNATASRAYELILRLDGSGALSAFANNEYFSYYLDDVTIKKDTTTVTPTATAVATPVVTPTPTPVPTVPVGLELKVSEALGSSDNFYFLSKPGALTADATANGTKTVSHTIYNTTNKVAHIQYSIQCYINGSWQPIGSAVVSGEIPANGSNTFTYNVENIVNGEVTKTWSGKTDTFTLDELMLRVNFTFEGGETVGDAIIVAADASDNIYNGNTSVRKISTAKVFTLPTVATPTPSATPVVTPTPTPAANKVVANGNVEDGLTNWKTFAGAPGGTLERVQPGANGTGNAIKFTPANKYTTSMFDLGPAIIKDAANGYNGGGAGTYKVTFYAKVEAGTHLSTKFYPTLNSQLHMNKGNQLGSHTFTVNTYFAATETITLTDAWQKYEVTFIVSEEFLENIMAAYAYGEARAYELGLRMDGAGTGLAFNQELYPYYIDEVTIEKGAAPTPTPTPTITTPPTGDPVGVKIDVTEDLAGGYVYWRATDLGLTEAMAVDNVITITNDVYNTSDHEIILQTMLQNGWSGFENNTAFKTIPAQSKMTFEVKVKTDGNGNAVKADGTVICALSALTYRFEFKANSIMTAGTSFVIAGFDGIFKTNGGVKSATSMTGNFTKTLVYELPTLQEATPTPTPTPTPVVNKEVTNGDVENGLVNWDEFAAAGGKLELAEPGVGGEGHAAKFTAAGKYDSIAFDLGPAIINAPEHGYNGGGAGSYIIGFWVKADANETNNKFNFVLNSQAHHQTGQQLGGYTVAMNTYITSGSVTTTTDWQYFETTVAVSQAFLDNLKGVYDAGKPSAYQLILRLDGAANAFKDSQYFSYYIDDVTIEKAKDPVGIKITTTEVYAGDHYMVGGTKVLQDDPTFTGKKSITYTFYNPSDVNMNIALSMQVTHKKADGNDTWADITKAASGVAAAGKKVTLTFTFDVENGMVKVTNGGSTALYSLDKLFLRINVKAMGANEAGKELIIGANDKNDMLYTISTAMKGKITPVTELPEMEETTPEDFAPKKENMNAEKGLVNWGTIHGGKIEHVTPGAAGTGHAVKFTPTNAQGKYNSIAFDLGPWIIWDKNAGYKGGGAGKYEVTFYAKADKTGKFNVMLNSQLHDSQAGVQKILGKTAAVGPTYISGPAIEMTRSWKKYTVTIDVKLDWYNMILRLNKSSHPNAQLAYQLALRFDGATQAFKNGAYGYQIDQISIKKVASYTNEVPVGVEIEAIDDHNQSLYFKTNGGYATKADVKDDVLTKTVKIKNTGSEDIMVQFELQATVKPNGKATWAAPVAGEWTEIPAGEEVEITYECDVDNGMVEIQGEEVKIEELFARFNVKNGDGSYEFVKGTKFQIRGTNTNEYKSLAKLTSGSAAHWTITPIYEKSTQNDTGDSLPVAMISAVAFAFVGMAVVVVAKKRREE